MKLLVALLFSAAAVSASPLAQTAAVQTQPDPEAPSIGFLKAGSEPVPAPESIAQTPVGWMAVMLPGPFSAFVPNQDLTKGLDVRPGAALYLEPREGAPVLTTAVKGDKITLTGLHGKWTQVQLDRPVSGYIHLGPLPPAPHPTDVPPPAAPVNLSTAGGAGHAAPAESATGPETPRFFEGLFASSHKLLSRWQPYPWQLMGSDGTRIAYLDVSKLLAIDQIDSFSGHEVQVFGPIKPIPGTSDIVIKVENLQLK